MIFSNLRHSVCLLQFLTGALLQNEGRRYLTHQEDI